MKSNHRHLGLLTALLWTGAALGAQDEVKPCLQPPGLAAGFVVSTWRAEDTEVRREAQVPESRTEFNQAEAPAGIEANRSQGEEAPAGELRDEVPRPEPEREQLRAPLGTQLLGLLEWRHEDRSVILGGRSRLTGFDAERMWFAPARSRRGTRHAFGRGRSHLNRGLGWRGPGFQGNRGSRRGGRF